MEEAHRDGLDAALPDVAGDLFDPVGAALVRSAWPGPLTLLLPARPDLDPDFVAVVERALEKDRSRRYETANALAAVEEARAEGRDAGAVRAEVRGDERNVVLTVADDGPGIPGDAATALLQRGMRLDEATPGHGIGLAVVKDIARSYGGRLSIGRSELGGAEIMVTIPPASPS